MMGTRLSPTGHVLERTEGGKQSARILQKESEQTVQKV